MDNTHLNSIKRKGEGHLGHLTKFFSSGMTYGVMWAEFVRSHPFSMFFFSEHSGFPSSQKQHIQIHI